MSDLKWDSGHRDDGNHRWKFPNQTCGVPGSAHTIYEQERDAAVKESDAACERARHDCVATGRYDPHVFYRAQHNAWVTEREKLILAAEKYAQSAPPDEARIVAMARAMATQSDDAIQKNYEMCGWLVENSEKGFSRRGGGPLGGLSQGTLFGLLFLIAVAIFLVVSSMGGGH